MSHEISLRANAVCKRRFYQTSYIKRFMMKPDSPTLPCKKRKIAIIDLGYVGCISAVGFAKLGFGVIGMDGDANKVKEICSRKPPQFELGLEEELRAGVAFGRSCLSKELPLLRSILPSTETHLQRALKQVLSLNGRRIGLIGLAVRLLMTYAKTRRCIYWGWFEPAAKRYDLTIPMSLFLPYEVPINIGHWAAFPNIADIINASLAQLLEWADELVLTQRPTQSLAEALHMSSLPSSTFREHHFLRR